MQLPFANDFRDKQRELKLIKGAQKFGKNELEHWPQPPPKKDKSLDRVCFYSKLQERQI